MNRITTVTLILIIAVSAYGAKPVSKETVKPIELTRATFLEKVFNYENNDTWKYSGDKPAIVDFYATWCVPCRITSPILKELAAEYGDDIYIYKIDIDREAELADLFGAHTIPMFLFIPMDEQPMLGVGALPKSSFKEAIDTFLLKKN